MEQTEKKVTVLIVDDDENLKEIYSQKLMNEDFAVLTANDGEEAIQKIKENFETLDVVLLDVVMPKMDGYDVLEKIRGAWGKYKKIPIIMLTSLSSPEDRERAKELGADRFFVKPERTPSDLVKEIREFLDEIHKNENQNLA
jgi:chemosensory pili system protein ChpA (sensor histidine kinase/response regulator)